MKKLFIFFQYILPQHLLSRLAGKLANCRTPFLKNLMIRLFIRHYQVNMAEALYPEPEHYACFNDFFTRQLSPDSRPLMPDPGKILCPADGSISAIGQIEAGRLLQAKGKDFSLQALLGDDESSASLFENGHFATVYLSPRDYHRVHMPSKGTLRKMTFIPGKLFSVNQTTSENISDLFASNERVACIFDTEKGPMALVLVGAMIVASIETVWAGLIAPTTQKLFTQSYNDDAVTLSQGEEMGRFKLGSTVIMLFGPELVEWDANISSLAKVQMGQIIGRREKPAHLQ